MGSVIHFRGRHKVVDLGLLVTAGFAHHMTELAYVFRGGLRNCENLCNQTKVSLLPRSFCLHRRRFTLDTADRPPVTDFSPSPPPHLTVSAISSKSAFLRFLALDDEFDCCSRKSWVACLKKIEWCAGARD